MYENDKQKAKNHLKNSCNEIIKDLIEDLNFTDEEKQLIIYRYIQYQYKWWICRKLHVQTTKYNDIHNSILIKLSTYLHLQRT